MRYIFLVLFVFVSLSSLAADLDQLTAKANAGDAAAQYQLGTMYNIGKGVDRNPDQAFAWFQKAARQGHMGAMYELAVAYYNGETLGGPPGKMSDLRGRGLRWRPNMGSWLLSVRRHESNPNSGPLLP